MGASRSRRPLSARARTAVAVMGLDTEARRYTVAGVAGTSFSTPARPKPADQRSSRSTTTAAERPGTPRRRMAAEMAASTAAARVGARAERPWVIVGGGSGEGEAGAGEVAGAGEGGCAWLAPAGARASTAPRASPLIPAAARRGRPVKPSSPLLEPIAVLQLPGQVLLGDEADAPPGERLELELLAAADHLLDLALPLRLLEPGVGEHLLRPVVVTVVHLDGDVARDRVLVLVEGREAHEAGVGHGHAHGLVGEVDRALLHDAVDVEAPGIVVHEHVDGQLQLVVQALHEAPHAARGLASALNDDALVALPELVLVEARPHRVLLDEEDVLRLVLLEGDDVL